MAEARKVNPLDITLPPEYQIEVAAEGLNVPINLVFTSEGDMLIADAGITDGNGKVLRRTSTGFEVVADGFTPPLTGINVLDGNIYVSHRGKITMVRPNGEKVDLIAGLPSFGDHHNNRVVFGPDRKMYFGMGTATNSGVVGTDNGWVKQHPYFHDFPGATVRLAGRNFETKNFLTATEQDMSRTGAFLPFGMSSSPGEAIRGQVAASGSILRADLDGSHLELVAWGLRNPFRLRFDRRNQLFATSHGMDERGSRPVANSPDEFQRIREGVWYGWPDYSGGYPVTDRGFKPAEGVQPNFILAAHPMRPPAPVATFAPHSAAMGFDFNEDPKFGPLGDVYVAEFGAGAPRTTGGKASPKVGHRVSRIDLRTGTVATFAINRSGMAASEDQSGGFERPIDAVFRQGEGEGLYVLDLGLNPVGSGFQKNTGVIWKITRRH